MPAFTLASGPEQTVAKDRPAGTKDGGLPSLNSGQQNAEVKLEGGDRKVEPSLLSVTGVRGSERQALGAEIKLYAPEVNPGQHQVLETGTVKAEKVEVSGVSEYLPSASGDLPNASVKSINPFQYSPP